MRPLVRVALLLVAGSGCGDHDEPIGAAGEPVTAASAASIDAVVAVVDAEDRVACSGTLVAPSVVITAAHCDAKEIRVGADAIHPRRVARVAERRAHEAFERKTLANDVAALRLDAPVDDVTPAVLLAEGARPTPGDVVVVVGYGRSGPLGAAAGDHLQRAGTARVIESDETKILLAPGPSQPCSGDSGGPVFAGAGRDALVAVTSHGDPDCIDGAAAIALGASARALTSWNEPEHGCAAGRGSGATGDWALFLGVLAVLRARKERV
jgi:Trypsin